MAIKSIRGLFVFVLVLGTVGIIWLGRVGVNYHRGGNFPLKQHQKGSAIRPLIFPTKNVTVSVTVSTLPPDPLYGQTITLVIRLATVPSLLRYLFCSCLQSAALFWSPKLGKVGFILDKESQKDHDFESKLRQQEHNLSLRFNVWYEPLPRDPEVLKIKWRKPDYNRQLWSSFVMDSYVSTSIIAWTDTDTTFTAPVTPENIFSNNGTKLRAIGMNMWHNRWVNEWGDATRQAIGKKMPSDFMTYFPVYIWTDTITNCRNHIMKHLKVKSFEDAFLEIYRPRKISPVNIIMSYAYHFEHDRYDWHIDVGNDDLSAYNKKHMEPDGEISDNDTSPEIHVTIHTKYYKSRVSPMKQGYCIARRHLNYRPADQCKEFEKRTANFQLFEFCNTLKQDHIKTWCRGSGRERKVCANLIKSHYQNVAKYHRMGWYDLNIQNVHAIQQAAMVMGIECPKEL